MTVRYIHDILKVDVKVKEALMNQIRSQVRNGQLNANDYLTARFEIPEVFISSQAKQGGVERDLYAEPISVNQPLEFVKDNKVVHKLRPVESYVLDDTGERILDFENLIRSQQQWRLNRNAPGIAEMSAHLGDLANAPEGDVMIDPSHTFEGDGWQGGGDILDTYLDSNNVTTNYNSSSYLYLKDYSNHEYRMLIGITHYTYDIGANLIIHSASLYLHNDYINGTPSDATACSYKVTRDWYPSSVTWSADGNGYYWSGGEYTTDYRSKLRLLPTSTPSNVEFDVTHTFKSHVSHHPSDLFDNGFLIKVTSQANNAYWRFGSCENQNTDKRPFMQVRYGFTQFCADSGNGSGAINTHHNNLIADKIYSTRYFDHMTSVINEDDHDDDYTKICAYLSSASAKGIKVLINTQSPAAYKDNYVDGKTAFCNRIEGMLDNIGTYISDGVVIGIEIGNEEEGAWYDTPPEYPEHYYGLYDDGERFAEYYLSAFSTIRNHQYGEDLMVVSGGSVEKHESIDWPHNTTYGSCREFIKGFIDKVISDGGRDKLPDAFAIHGYPGKMNPEFYSNTDDEEEPDYDTTYKRSTQEKRIKELFDVCNNRGYIPNFLMTEYGMSISDNNWGPTDAIYADEIDPSTKTQAVYIVRKALLYATSMAGEGIGWYNNIYWSHTYNELSTYFFDPARYASRKLFDTEGIIQLSHEYSKIWLPFTVTLLEDGKEENALKKAACGWITNRIPQGQQNKYERWAVIWQFKEKLNRYYKPLNDNSLSFTINGDFATNYNHQLYKFDFDEGDPTDIFDEKSLNDLTVTHSSGVTTVTVDIVTENPTFIRFIPNF